MGVTPPHPRTSYNLFFLEEECIGTHRELEKHGCESEFIVGSFEKRFICMLRSNSRVDFAQYVFLNISVIIDSTYIHLASKCAERQRNHNAIPLN